MNDAETALELEAALAQMLKPIKGIPFSTIVKSICNYDVIRNDPDLATDRELIATLDAAIATGSAGRFARSTVR